MRVPMELTFRGVEKTEYLENLIRDKAGKLEQVYQDMISCRVAVEGPQKHQRSGSPYRVRIDIGVPNHEIVVRRESGEGSLHDDLPKVVRNAFDAARRQLQGIVERQRGETKAHPEQESVGLVVRLFPEEDYGFFKTPEGREIYFHRNSVLQDDFDRLAVGTGVRFFEESGEKGPQASTVQIVDKPGERATKSEEEPEPAEPPLGWEEQ